MLLSCGDGEEQWLKPFLQHEILSVAGDPAPSVTQLLSMIKELVEYEMIRQLRIDKTLCWSLRPASMAAKLSGGQVTEKERKVFKAVEDAQKKGIWAQEIKAQTKLVGKQCDGAITKLQNLGLIRLVTNVKAPMKKMYMAGYLAADVEMTGGVFYNNGELDEHLIEELGKFIVFHLRRVTWGVEREGAQVAHKAGTRFQSAEDIYQSILRFNIIHEEKQREIKVKDIQQIVDVLVLDEKIEKVGGGYRSVRGVRTENVDEGEVEDEVEDDVAGGNGFTESPCGRCPVFDFCSDTGPINPTGCVYWKDWLGR
ncbi:hypothetical protein K470DRAFT_210224 [Piedraia hortae CBS 480.64]|uniref:DNA-directed RNA polymerase III subunit RPC6 n=1 Tax=Piedraia hortae CBS 480.64 TaxID=1314780 RepID=A0A6A7C859_9PEZI|nr:hypothetical protein K470DRAFT_210224 [Piedraia hortae CBS 480.64]